jgi:MFS family permease
MNSLNDELGESRPHPRTRAYYGWVHVFVAAAAMVGTLPGRTQGLGLVTESLLKDLNLDRIAFAHINLWATLIGALLCIGVGRLIDRIGSRSVITAIAVMLGLAVLWMSQVTAIAALAIAITLTRGLGQSALSVASITIVGRSFAKRINLAMAVYSILLSVGFMIAFPLVGYIVETSGWRVAWRAIGLALLLLLAPLALIFVRRTYESTSDATAAEFEGAASEHHDGRHYTLLDALRTPAFWVFSISSAFYGLVASGIALFNEAILGELGFRAFTYYRSLVIIALTSLVGNFLGGWLSEKWSMKRLMSLAMALLAAALLALPQVRTEVHVAIYAAVMGIAGGFVIVIFFSFWSKTYGRYHLGRIQGAAQAMTVVASAIGPLVLAESVEYSGSYASAFYIMAGVIALLGLAVAIVPLPSTEKRNYGTHGN